MNAMQYQTMILASGNQPTIGRRGDETICVATPLDAIMRLERVDGRRRIGTVVLAGGYASDGELARVLGVLYPAVRIEREV